MRAWRLTTMFLSCIVSVVVPAHASDPLGPRFSGLPSSAQTSISAALGRDLAGYHARHFKDGFVAHGSRPDAIARFGAKGVELRSGTVDWSIRLAAYGYGNAVQSVGQSIPEARLNRVEYRRGSLTEWYVNGPAGVEQGFTIRTRPPRGSGELLTLVLEISQNFSATIGRDGTSVTLKSEVAGKDLRCSDLRASDATGRELRSWFEIRDRKLRLLVDQRGARYPVVVDPLIQLAELTASDGQASFEPQLGISVAVSGDTIVAGANGAEVDGTVSAGAVYVFAKPASGWADATQVAKLTALDTYEHVLGFSVAISGDTVVTGSPDAEVQGVTRLGAVYVFVKPATGWADMTQTAKLTASDGKSGDGLGVSVSISGNTIVAGAANANEMAGKAYVFVKPKSGWADITQTAELTPSHPVADSIFGQSISIESATVVVGAPYGNLAYVFARPTEGWKTMHQTAQLSPSDLESFDLFGHSVSISGDTIAVGKPTSTNPGSAYIFVEPATGWTDMTQTAKISPSNGMPDDWFGTSVFVSGSLVLVGAPGATELGGAAYLFLKPKSGWANTSKFNAELSGSSGAAGVGTSVSSGASIFVVGAPGTSVGSDSNSPGAAYIFGR
jgi:hypothetical protein